MRVCTLILTVCELLLMENSAVLKKPLHTSIAVEMDEFDEIDVPEKLHIIISVRDFRAILQHANWTSTELNAAYSRPGRPMKISYSGDGITCEFILMTVDEKSTTSAQRKGNPQAAAKAARPALDAASSGRPASGAETRARQPSPSQQQQQEQRPRSQMPPPPRPAPPRSSQFDIRAPTKQPPSTLKSDSLFLPQPDEDEQWAPVNTDEDDEEGENARLEWDASNEPVSSLPPVWKSDRVLTRTAGFDNAHQRPFSQCPKQPCRRSERASAVGTGAHSKVGRCAQIWALLRLAEDVWVMCSTSYGVSRACELAGVWYK